METPKSVQHCAQELVKAYGESFEKRGVYNGKQVYQYIFPQEIRTGYPFIYLYEEKTNEVEEITGLKAMDILYSI